MMQHGQQLKKILLDACMCLSGIMCQTSVSLAGSCGEREKLARGYEFENDHIGEKMRLEYVFLKMISLKSWVCCDFIRNKISISEYHKTTFVVLYFQIILSLFYSPFLIPCLLNFVLFQELPEQTCQHGKLGCQANMIEVIRRQDESFHQKTIACHDIKMLILFIQACILNVTGHAALPIINCMESSSDVINAAQPVRKDYDLIM